MTNVELLATAIEQSGKKKDYLAQKCGLSRFGFFLKCKGENEFTASEINILCSELGITKLSDKERIFFAK